jgi:hypothetical protein
MAEGNESQDLNIQRGTLHGTDGLKTQLSRQSATTDEVLGEMANTSPPHEHDFEDDRAAETKNHSHPAHNTELNGKPSESSANQDFYHMRRSDFSQDFYAFAMENANDCEHVARELQTMYHHNIVKLRSASLRMELPRPMRSASQAQRGDVHDTSKLLKTAVTDLIANRQKCRDLLGKIHHFGKIAWDQHKLICDIGDELDRVVYALEEQQRVNKDILEQLHSAHESQRERGDEMDTLENTQVTSMGENTTEENRTSALSEIATDDSVDWGSPSTDSELLAAVKNAIDM